MRKNSRRVFAGVLAATMSLGMMAMSASAEEATTIADDDVSAEGFTADESLSGVSITMLNSKGEIQTGLESMAAAFEEASGVKVEILACGSGEVPYTKITSMYNSGTAPTMAMLDTTDVIALGAEYAMDLTDENWTKECADSLTYIDDVVYSFPFCIEGRGIIYNKTAIEDTLGEEFDADSIDSFQAFDAILVALREAGMEDPVVVSKEDWSLGAHQLGYIYDTYDGTTAGADEVMAQLKSGELKAIDYDRFSEFMDTLDVCLEYNINKDDPLGAIYDEDPMFLVDGEAAFWLNGCWAWPNLESAGATTEDEYGFIPFVLGNDTEDFANTSMQAAASKQVIIDNKQATEEQQKAAKEFLDWMVYSEEGQKALVEECAIIPACTNNETEPVDPLGKDIKNKMAEGRVYSSSFVAPSDHWSVMGAEMQKYVAGEQTKEELAAAIDSYWTSQE